MNSSCAFLEDFDLARRGRGASERAAPNADIIAAVGDTLRAAERFSIAYTAFDGDHFQLCGHMRRHVMALGRVPANPESILGYRDVVTAHGNKREVLRDDLSILGRCDELWVFTGCRPTPAGVADLAEGVIAELLYFLSHAPGRPVRFVNPLSLLGCGAAQGSQDCRPVSFDAIYADVVAALPTGLAEPLTAFLATTPGSLRPLLYYVHDPLDFKYASWLRADAYKRQAAPLVPALAVELAEAEHGARAAAPPTDPLELAVVAWAALGRLASKACRLPPIDADRSPSFVAAVLAAAFERHHGPGSVEERSWAELPIPKARDREHWSLTDRERHPRR